MSSPYSLWCKHVLRQMQTTRSPWCRDSCFRWANRLTIDRRRCNLWGYVWHSMTDGSIGFATASFELPRAWLRHRRTRFHHLWRLPRHQRWLGKFACSSGDHHGHDVIQAETRTTSHFICDNTTRIPDVCKLYSTSRTYSVSMFWISPVYRHVICQQYSAIFVFFLISKKIIETKVVCGINFWVYLGHHKE